jgi:hypothetical protein
MVSACYYTSDPMMKSTPIVRGAMVSGVLVMTPSEL